MAIVHTTEWLAQSGRQGDLRAVVRAAREYHEQLGFGVQVWRAAIAAESSGRILYALHSDSLGQHFARLHQLEHDRTWGSWWGEVRDGAGAPAVEVSATLYSSEPSFTWAPIPAPNGEPLAMFVTEYAPLEPQLRAAFVPALPEILALAASLGLTPRVTEAMVAGPSTGSFCISYEAPNLAVLGASLETLRADAGYRALSLRLRSLPVGPRITRRALYVEHH